MFVLKKIVTLLLMPMSLCLGVLGVGILLLWVRRRIGAAKIVLTLGLLVLTALSFSAVADQFIKPLELWYPPLLGYQWAEGFEMGGGSRRRSHLQPDASAQCPDRQLLPRALD